MVAVFADANHVEELTGEFPRVSVGAYNGPNTVLSGPGEDLEQIVARFGDEGIRCTWLETSHAFHSELLDPVLDEFESYAAQLQFAVPTLPLVCNRTGAVLTAQTPIDAQVLAAAFPPAGAIRRKRAHRGGAGMLGADGDRSATGADRRCGTGLAGAPGRAAGDRLATQGRWRPTPDRRRAGRGLRRRPPTRFRQSAAPAAAADSNCPPIRSSAAASGPSRPASPIDRGPRYSGILGSAKDLASGDSVYTSRLSVKSQPWLSDHVIYGTVVVPGATYAAMALAAVGAPARVKDVFFYEPIILPEKSFSRGAADIASDRRATASGWIPGAQPPLR